MDIKVLWSVLILMGGFFTGCDDDSASQKSAQTGQAGTSDSVMGGSARGASGGVEETSFTGQIGDDDAAKAPLDMGAPVSPSTGGRISVNSVGGLSGTAAGRVATGGARPGGSMMTQAGDNAAAAGAVNVAGRPVPVAGEPSPGGSLGGMAAGVRAGGAAGIAGMVVDVAGIAVGPSGGLGGRPRGMMGGAAQGGAPAVGGMMGRQPGGMPALGGQNGPECQPGMGVGICEICGVNGERFAPQRDLECADQVECEPSRYRTEDVGGDRRCIEVRSQHNGRCSGIGACAAAAESCMERDVLLAVQNECADIIDCEGNVQPNLNIQPTTTPCGGGTNMCGRLDGVMACIDWQTATRQKVRDTGYRPCTWSATQERRFQFVFAEDDGVQRTCNQLCRDMGWSCFQVALRNSAPCRADGMGDIAGDAIRCNQAGVNLYCKCRID